MEHKEAQGECQVSSSDKLIEGEDYYINEDGRWVFTEKYHLDRGYCCDNHCLHCPYGNSRSS